MTSDVCRFCLHNYEDKNDPFTTPCKCTGSVKYVHRSCIQRWRYSAPLPEHRVKCQLCHAPYVFPRKWPAETSLLPDSQIRFALSHSFVISLLTHYFHMLYTQYSKGDTPYNTYLLSAESRYSYMYIVGFLTLIYAVAFGSGPIYVRNKMLYLYYMWRLHTRYIGSLFVSVCIMPFVIFPANMLYIACLARFATIHNDIVIRINIDGEE